MGENKLNKFCILGVKISVIDINDACLLVEDAILKRHKIYICVCSVSTIMECKRNEKVLTSVNSADLVTPDGMPVVWIGRMQGYTNIRRVYGPDLMQKICDISAKKGYRHYFYGSSHNTLNKLEEKLSKKYPGLIISGSIMLPISQGVFKLEPALC